jgi:hypothetical protein|tara:strand:- start:117 stop:401 length:285 start_codon:yes stop_codon:yes gene_type:complete
MRTKKDIQGVIRSYTANAVSVTKIGGFNSNNHMETYLAMIKILLWVIEEKGGYDVPEHYLEGDPHCLFHGPEKDKEKTLSVTEEDIVSFTEQMI